MTTCAPAPTDASPAPGDAMVLAHAAASVPEARSCLAQRLAHLPRDLVDDALLVLSELLGNAVRHTAAGGHLEVRWSASPGALLLEVVDAGGGVPRVADRGHGAVSGRGMAIVEALSQSWGTTTLDDGRRAVWSRLVA